MAYNLWDNLEGSLATIGREIGLAVVNRDFRVTRANRVHSTRFPGVNDPKRKCFDFCNLFKKPCPWCPVERTFDSRQIEIGAPASPDPHDKTKTGIVYTYIISIPYERDEDGEVTSAIEVIFYVSDDIKREWERRVSLHQRLAEYSELLERIRPDPYVPDFILFGAVSRYALDMDEAVVVVFQEGSVPSLEATVDTAMALKSDQALNRLERRLEISMAADDMPGPRALIRKLERSHRSLLPEVDKNATIAQWLEALEPKFGPRMQDDELRAKMLLPLAFRMGPQRAGVFLSARGGRGPYGLLTVKRTRQTDEVSPLVLDGDLVDLSLYAALIGQALTARHDSAVFQDATRRVRDVLAQYEGEPQALLFASGLAAGYAHDMLTACARVGSLWDLIEQMIPKDRRSKPQTAITLKECKERIEFIRLCGDGIGNVARTADPSKVKKRVRSLFAIARNVCAGFGPILRTKKIKLTNSLPPASSGGDAGDASVVACDELLMRMVFTNVLHNAVYWVQGIKGRPAAIKVSGRASPTHVEITIKDYGYGIAPGAIKRIWEPFYSSRRADQGMGLGLFIARRIVEELHGGRIEVESEWGYSTEFTISLPKAAASPTVATEEGR